MLGPTQVIGEHDTIDLVSSGHDSDVLLVRERRTGALYLFKQLRRGQFGGGESLDRNYRFAKEVSISASLDHSAIAKPISAVVGNEGEPGLFYPYRKGRTLESILSQGAIFSPQDASRLLLPVLDALEHIHNRGIFHCDLNPNNIFVDDDQGVQIIDFGLALTENEAGSMPEGKIRGTPPYLSPEQTGLTRYRIDARSDLFCAGLILYRLVSGSLPFPVNDLSVMGLVDSVLKHDFRPLKRIPAALNAILLKALKHSLDERYQTAQGFAFDLRTVVDSLSSGFEPEMQIGFHDTIAAANRPRLFVGRMNEVDALLRAHRRVASSRDQMSVLISGPSGIGKTETVNEFRKQSHSANQIHVAVKCNRFTPHQPYIVIRQVVLEVLQAVGQDPKTKTEFRRQITEELIAFSGVICRSIPEMRSVFTDVPVMHEVESDREAERTKHVLVNMLATLLKVSQIVVAIDDIQWIDRASYEVFRLAKKEKPSFLFIACYRDEEGSSGMPLYSGDVRDFGFDRHLQLRKFGRSEIDGLLRERFGKFSGIETLAESLLERTDGKPFTLSSACRWLVEAEVLQLNSHCWKLGVTKDLPSRFDPVSLFLDKTKKLNESTKDYLQLAALIEGHFGPQVLAVALEKSLDQARDALNTLERKGLLRARLNGEYGFAHDGIQESIARELHDSDKWSLFKKLTNAYIHLAGDDNRFLLNAAECSLKCNDRDLTLKTCIRAGEYASGAMAFDAAIRYFSRALLLASHDSNSASQPDGVKLVELKLKLGEVLALTGRKEQALKTYRNCLGDECVTCDTLEVEYRIAAIHHNSSEFGESVPLLKNLLSQLGGRLPANPYLLLWTLLCEIALQLVPEWLISRLGESLQSKGRRFLKLRVLNKLSYSLYFEDMLSAFTVHFKALNLGRAMGDCYEKAEAYTSHTVPSYQLLGKNRSFAFAEKALSIASRIHRVDAQAFALSFGGMVRYYSGNWKKAEEMLLRSVELFRGIGDVSGQVISEYHLWSVLLLRGDFANAKGVMERSLDRCAQISDKHYLHITRGGLAKLRFLSGGDIPEEQVGSLRVALNDSSAALTKTKICVYLVDLLISLKRDSEASEILREVRITTRKKSFNSEYIVPLLISQLEIGIRFLHSYKDGPTRDDTRRERCENEFRRTVSQLRFAVHTYPAYQGAYWRCKAQYARYFGNRRMAEKLFQKAITAHHSFDMRYEEARSIREYASFLEDCGLAGSARDEYNKAFRLFLKCGAKFDCDCISSKVDDDVVREYSDRSTDGAIDASETKSTVVSMNTEIDRLRLQTLHDLSATMTTMEEPNELLKQVLAAQMRVTGARYGTLFLESHKTPEGRTLAMDFEGRVMKSNEMFYSKGILERAKSGEAVRVSDSQILNKEVSSETEAVKSVMCVPLTKLEKYLGCVYLANDNVGGLFTEGALKAAQILAAQGAILLENAYLMDDYRRLNRELAAKVQEQTSDIREKNNQLEAANLRLIESERMKAILSGTIVHDIKNYASGIQGSMQILSKKAGEHDKKIGRLVRLSSEACNDIVSLASNMLDIEKMEDGRLVVNRSPMHPLEFEKMLAKMTGQVAFTEKNIAVLADPVPQGLFVHADSYLLGRVLQNLYNNAAKYTPEDGIVRFSVTREGEEDIVCLFSSGDPIPPECRETIFEKYSRMSGQGSQYSKGLGLFFCKMVMNAHHGRIWVDTDDTGNYFKLGFKLADRDHTGRTSVRDAAHY